MTHEYEILLSVKRCLYPNIPWTELTDDQKEHIKREGKKSLEYAGYFGGGTYRELVEWNFQKDHQLPRPYKYPGFRPKGGQG